MCSGFEACHMLRLLQFITLKKGVTGKNKIVTLVDIINSIGYIVSLHVKIVCQTASV